MITPTTELPSRARNKIADQVRLAAGDRLGPYEVLSPLGAGGMGEVYRARDPRLGREVAIKVLPAERVADERRRRRLVQEARSASALNHPYIVTIHEIDSADGIDFIVMEYVPCHPRFSPPSSGTGCNLMKWSGPGPVLQ